VLIKGDGSSTVRDVRHDARDVQAQDVFVARKGQHRDGSEFVAQAIERGCALVISERALPHDVPQIIVQDAHRALAFASSAVWRHPSFSLEVLGVTGTNGKTSTTWLLEHTLQRCGQPTGLLGTVEHRFGAHRWPALHTTPEADDIARRMAAMRAAGADNVAMEVSSHALALGRCEAVRFRIAGFTNLTQDHLDFHRSLEQYAQSKYRLFAELGPAISVLNIDDPTGARWANSALKSQLIRYSARGQLAAEFAVTSAQISAAGVIAEVNTPDGPVTLRSPMVGHHNIENLLLAMAMAWAREVSIHDVVAALADAVGAPGRLEPVGVPSEQNPLSLMIPSVFVDYAHTPDALRNVLAALDQARLGTSGAGAAVGSALGTSDIMRAHRPPQGRLICVFGCGGDRDAGKRPLMGAAASEGAHLCIVTTDNPRSESPEHIAEQAAEGFDLRQTPRWNQDDFVQHFSAQSTAVDERAVTVIVDRRAAIGAAVAIARPQDIVLIAGKGHEPYQEIHGVRHPFDDRIEARAALAQWLRERSATGHIGDE
jgi:UDP-N-acetylmuramoyl-L-alanyl-D-glutamate--2,6-diaminopimelate ligase